MSKHGSARAVLAGAAIIALAGCGVPAATAPDIPSQTGKSTSTGATSQPSSAAPVASGRQSATSATSGRQKETPQSFVKANSIPFPVAVGNTWVYQTTASGETGQTTNRIVSAGPGPAGYEVTMSSTTEVAGTATALQPVYVFYPDGTIGYPVPPINGVSVPAGSIRWPDAAGLASGQAYHSVLRTQVSQTGQYENANVTVQGVGTMSVSVPAGTYQASVVETTIAGKVGGYATTVEVTTWIAQGVGPVKTEVLIRAAGTTELTTNELLSFTKGAVPGIGS
ncbi:MAG: hypothetical protein ACLQB1_42330 [Streptosporangiaceae bacterium]